MSIFVVHKPDVDPILHGANCTRFSTSVLRMQLLVVHNSCLAHLCRFLYSLDLPIKDKVEAIARSYGAASVEYSEEAEAQIERYTKQGFAGLPICMAKTQYSFSADANAKGAPSGFVLPIREVCAPFMPACTCSCLCLLLNMHADFPADSNVLLARLTRMVAVTAGPGVCWRRVPCRAMWRNASDSWLTYAASIL